MPDGTVRVDSKFVFIYEGAFGAYENIYYDSFWSTAFRHNQNCSAILRHMTGITAKYRFLLWHPFRRIFRMCLQCPISQREIILPAQTSPSHDTLFVDGDLPPDSFGKGQAVVVGNAPKYGVGLLFGWHIARLD